MSVLLKKVTAFIIAAVTVFASFTIAMPPVIMINAAESVTPISNEESLKAALEGDGGSYSLSADITLTVEKYEEFRYVVIKNVTLDLNGHSVTIKNTSNLTSNTNDSTLIKVESGGSLTINDSSPNNLGSLLYIGGIHLYNEDDSYKDFTTVTGRHLVYLCTGASMTVNGGKLSAGNTEKEWLHRAAGVVKTAFEFYTGFAENTVCGTVITAAESSELTVNGGTFTANGRKRQNALPNLKGWDNEQAASVCIKAEAKATVNVNDGVFIGSHGADVFSLDESSKSSIKAGKFETTPSVNERVADYMDFATVNVSTYYGKLNLPTVFIPANSRDALSQNGQPLEKTADALHGSPVYLTPYTGATAKITSSSIKTSYTPGAKGTLSAGYTPYFTEGSKVKYSWYAVSVNGSVTPVESSDSSTLDLSNIASNGITLALGSNYSFRCVITETLGSYTLTTVAKSFSFDTANKYILPAVSLTPSKIDDNNNYYAGSAPTFSVPSGANYSLDSVKWYNRHSTDEIAAPVSLKENSHYFVVFTLSSKGNYRFTSDTRISFLPGGTTPIIAPSFDGQRATVTAYITTACSHSCFEYIANRNTHDEVCTVCGFIASSTAHTYSEWTETNAEASETVPMERTCSVCSHKENSAIFAPITDEKAPIYEIKTDIGSPDPSSAPAAPQIYSTPDAPKVLIDSYTWLSETGTEFTAFEPDGKYILTVVYKLTDPESTVFSESTKVSSVHPSKATVTFNEDMTEMTVTYNVTTLTAGERQIYLPPVKIGQELSKSNIDIKGNATVHWYKDGNKIGYSEIVDGVETEYDYDPDDEIDYLTHIVEEGSVYYCRINWHILVAGNKVDKSKVNFTNTVSDGHCVLGGEFGFATAYYLAENPDPYIRSIKISEIAEPTPGGTAKTSGGKTNSNCNITNIKFTNAASKVSKFECGKVYTVSVTLTPISGYTFDLIAASINGHAASVTVSGNNVILTCSFEALEHNFDNKNAETVLPTCDKDGSVTAKCKNCSATSVTSLEELGHTLSENTGVASTCEKDGISTHYSCIYCLKIFNDNKAITEITKDSTVIPKDSTKHTGETQLVHDGNNHFTVCVGCSATIDEPTAHEYGDNLVDAEGNEYHSCECGHSIPLSGPKQPEFVIGGTDEELIPPPVDEGFDLGGFSIDTIKTILLIMIIFAVILIGSIITISVILIVTRDKNGGEPLPDETEEKEQLTASGKTE